MISYLSCMIFFFMFYYYCILYTSSITLYVYLVLVLLFKCLIELVSCYLYCTILYYEVWKGVKMFWNTLSDFHCGTKGLPTSVHRVGKLKGIHVYQTYFVNINQPLVFVALIWHYLTLVWVLYFSLYWEMAHLHASLSHKYFLPN